MRLASQVTKEAVYREDRGLAGKAGIGGGMGERSLCMLSSTLNSLCFHKHSLRPESSPTISQSLASLESYR